MNLKKIIPILLSVILIIYNGNLLAYSDYNVNQIISVGTGHVLVIKSDGSLWAWGENDKGQIGNGVSGEDAYEATPIKVLDSVKSVSAFGPFSMAIKNDGTLWTWGDNGFGELGIGSDKQKAFSAIPVKIMDDVKAISSGYWHAMAIKNDGTLWAWGYNYDGQLGDGTSDENADKFIPVKIMDDVRFVSAGYSHTMAIKNDDTLWAWGANYYGELGYGSGGKGQYIPKPIQIINDVYSVSAGYHNTMAIKKMDHYGRGV